LSVNRTTGFSPHDALNQEEPMELPNTYTRAEEPELEANTGNNIETAFINDPDYDAIVPHNPADEIPEMRRMYNAPDMAIKSSQLRKP
jgi:hypothetical protein